MLNYLSLCELLFNILGEDELKISGMVKSTYITKLLSYHTLIVII